MNTTILHSSPFMRHSHYHHPALPHRADGEHRPQSRMLPNQDDLIGRIVVHYQRTGRNSYLWYKDALKFPIHEIYAKRIS